MKVCTTAEIKYKIHPNFNISSSTHLNIHNGKMYKANTCRVLITSIHSVQKPDNTPPLAQVGHHKHTCTHIHKTPSQQKILDLASAASELCTAVRVPNAANVSLMTLCVQTWTSVVIHFDWWESRTRSSAWPYILRRNKLAQRQQWTMPWVDAACVVFRKYHGISWQTLAMPAAITRAR